MQENLPVVANRLISLFPLAPTFLIATSLVIFARHFLTLQYAKMPLKAKANAGTEAKAPAAPAKVSTATKTESPGLASAPDHGWKNDWRIALAEGQFFPRMCSVVRSVEVHVAAWAFAYTIMLGLAGCGATSFYTVVWGNDLAELERMELEGSGPLSTLVQRVYDPCFAPKAVSWALVVTGCALSIHQATLGLNYRMVPFTRDYLGRPLGVLGAASDVAGIIAEQNVHGGNTPVVGFGRCVA